MPSICEGVFLVKKAYVTPQIQEYSFKPESCLTTSLVAADAQLDNFGSWVKNPNPR